MMVDASKFSIKKNQARQNMLQQETRQNYKTYRNLRREAKCICCTKKKKMMKKRIEKIKESNKMGNSRLFYKKKKI